MLPANRRYKAFRHAAALARRLNRTLVLPEFSVHHSDSKEWFKQRPVWWGFNQTFDQKIFQSKYKSVTLAEFARLTKQLDLVVGSMKYEPGTEKQIPGRLVQITDPLKMMSRYGFTAKRTDWGNSTTWEHLEEITIGLPYVAVRIDHFGLPLQTDDSWCPALRDVHQALQRTENVRSIVDKYIASEFGGEDYLAVHFRLSDQCGNSPPDFASCYHQTPFGTIWKRLVELCDSMGIKHVYIAAPPLLHWIMHFVSSTTIDQFDRKKDASRVKLHYISIHQSNSKLLGKWAKQNYVVSMVDQELCVRAKKFVYAGQSMTPNTHTPHAHKADSNSCLIICRPNEIL